MSLFEQRERACGGFGVEHAQRKADVNDHVVTSHGFGDGMQADLAPYASVVACAETDPVTFECRDDENRDGEAHGPKR